MGKRTFTEDIRHAIETCGLNHSEICRRSGIDIAAMSRFTNRIMGLKTDSLDKLLPVLGLRVVSDRVPPRRKRRT